MSRNTISNALSACLAGVAATPSINFYGGPGGLPNMPGTAIKAADLPDIVNFWDDATFAARGGKLFELRNPPVTAYVLALQPEAQRLPARSYVWINGLLNGASGAPTLALIQTGWWDVAGAALGGLNWPIVLQGPAATMLAAGIDAITDAVEIPPASIAFANGGAFPAPAYGTAFAATRTFTITRPNGGVDQFVAPY